MINPILNSNMATIFKKRGSVTTALCFCFDPVKAFQLSLKNLVLAF
jgi:hypothetical protein